MYKSSIGPLDGKSWEDLCQLVFKAKFSADGYQQVVASPGDFGLEGFTKATGIAFQCYCPEKNYDAKDLHEAQRDKISRDIKKLQKHATEIHGRLGDTRIKKWIFVTPEVSKNELLAHAREKEKEARSWGLDILDSDFTILIHDVGHYLSDINAIRAAAGEPVLLDEELPNLEPLNFEDEQYEKNIRRKCQLRLAPKQAATSYDRLLAQLSQQSVQDFLEGDHFFARIEERAPPVYYRLLRLVREFEYHVQELALTWTADAESLATQVRTQLASKIYQDMSPDFDLAMSERAARLMTARWTAVCKLDYE